LPHPGELSLSAENFRVIRFDEPGTVTVGAGVVLWILQHFLRRHGYDLPVLNDGYPGPSVGGFIASGGFGPRSALFGGFWNNVVDVGLMDGHGNVRRVARTDPLFRWLFGSMGQLGIFLDATLQIVPLEGSVPAPYPQGTRLVPPRLDAPKIPTQFIVEADDRLFWFTLFVPDDCMDDAHRELSELEKRYSNVLRFQERYRYPISVGDVVAPLVYPFARKFTATGAWGWLTDNSADRIARLQDFDRAFMDLTAGNPDYRRYVQSEIALGPTVYRQCFGEEIYNEFCRLKEQLDPHGLLNRGSVFSVPEAAQQQAQPKPPKLI
jgi:FAD/FMN-containing dehydrogenase